MHRKRSSMPMSWPVPRKKGKFRYVLKASHASAKSIPVLFILRDILKIVKTRKEANVLLRKRELKINSVVRVADDFPVQVFDTISLDSSGKYYRLEIEQRKFTLKEISKEDALLNTAKIIGKKIISGNKVQMNLDDGRNILTDVSFSLGDSVIFNTLTNTLQKVLPLTKGAKVEVISGKHAGKRGEFVGVEALARGKSYLVKLGEREVSLPLKTLLVIA